MWADRLRVWAAAAAAWWSADCWPWRRRPRSLGQRGEDAAAKFLKRRGYKIVGRGERNRLGEIDIVAVDGRTLVFVEVKTLASLEHGLPSERVDRDKQQRLTRLAIAWLKRRRLLEYPARFDVISITWPDSAKPPQIEHLISAFEARGFDGMYS